MAYLRKIKNRQGKIYYYIGRSFRENGVVKHENIKYIGRFDIMRLHNNDPESFAQAEVNKYNRENKKSVLVTKIISTTDKRIPFQVVGHITAGLLYEQLEISATIKNYAKLHNLSNELDDIIRHLMYNFLYGTNTLNMYNEKLKLNVDEAIKHHSISAITDFTAIEERVHKVIYTNSQKYNTSDVLFGYAFPFQTPAFTPYELSNNIVIFMTKDLQPISMGKIFGSMTNESFGMCCDKFLKKNPIHLTKLYNDIPNEDLMVYQNLQVTATTLLSQFQAQKITVTSTKNEINVYMLVFYIAFTVCQYMQHILGERCSPDRMIKAFRSMKVRHYADEYYETQCNDDAVVLLNQLGIDWTNNLQTTKQLKQFYNLELI